MDLVEAKARGFDVGRRHPWERARLALVARLIARHTTLRTGDVVLDIGCGDTFVVERLARLYPGTRFYAVDNAFTPELIAIYRSRLTVPNVSLFASLDDVPQDRPASLVLLMDVIEHVADDVALLGDLMRRPCVGPETCALITVPSYPSLFCSHDRFLGHYRRYSTPTLLVSIAAAQLSAIEAGHLFASLLPVRVLQVLRERLSRSAAEPATGLAMWEGSESRARALAALLELDGRFGLLLLRVGIRIPGLSTFAICRKSAS
jgi:2-polyprenyl-3-methyl-5-hydroxy-6-metoxy-1,4-benzoquinol methylase